MSNKNESATVPKTFTSETHTHNNHAKRQKASQPILKNAKHVQEDVGKGISDDDDRETMMVNPTLEFHPRETPRAKRAINTAATPAMFSLFFSNKKGQCDFFDEEDGPTCHTKILCVRARTVVNKHTSKLFTSTLLQYVRVRGLL